MGMKDTRSEGTHTPGPWTVSQRGSDCVIKHSDGELVSYVATLYAGALCPEHGTVAANARLIAKAPALLDALRAFCGDHEATNFACAGLNAAYQHARHLISEIDGGSDVELAKSPAKSTVEIADPFDRCTRTEGCRYRFSHGGECAVEPRTQREGDS